MPIYEYQCKKCSTIFEEWLNSSESDLEQTCPNCKEKAQRIVSQTSFVLKGSGWYVTEYGKNSASSNPVKKNDIPNNSVNAKEDKSSVNDNSSTSTKKVDAKADKLEKKAKPKKENSAK